MRTTGNLRPFVAWVTLAWASAAPGASYPLPPEPEAVIGTLRWVRAVADDTLVDIAGRHGVGYEELILANPDVDRWLPEPGTKILLPTRFILPRTPRNGVVINVAEMRMYFYPAGQRRVLTFPVSIGREEWKTPIVTTHVTQLEEDPAWRPPQSIRAEYAADGIDLPEVVPPGPDNPLGPQALRLGIHGYLIHGTNKPLGVGMRVTHGCIRMNSEDMRAVFAEVVPGTPVRIVNQPYKAGYGDGKLYIEWHPPSSGAQDALARFKRTVQSGLQVSLHPRIFEAMDKPAHGIPWPLKPSPGRRQVRADQGPP